MSFHVNRSGVEPYSRGKSIKHTTKNGERYFTKRETCYLSGENCSAHHCLIDGLRKSIQDELPVRYIHNRPHMVSALHHLTSHDSQMYTHLASTILRTLRCHQTSSHTGLEILPPSNSDENKVMSSCLPLASHPLEVLCHVAISLSIRLSAATI